jgi:splicing factor 3B subunit 1
MHDASCPPACSLPLCTPVFSRGPKSSGSPTPTHHCCALQGLFHPARKVREIYWRLYNSAYIGAQDALVACYPRMEDEGINSYRRHELDVFL